MAFEIASANLVVELGATLSCASGCFREQGRRPIAGSMEGHTAIGHVPAGSPWASGACTRSNPTTFTQFNSYIYECNRNPQCQR